MNWQRKRVGDVIITMSRELGIGVQSLMAMSMLEILALREHQKSRAATQRGAA